MSGRHGQAGAFTSGGSRQQLRICIVYDRLYPWSIGGAERWYRLLAERLAAEDHRVTYLTTRQWLSAERHELPGVEVIALPAQGPLYSDSRRRTWPVVQFGLAVWRHLYRHGRDYDVVHGAAMSSWSALAAASLARRRGYRLVLDWWEVWSWRYWRDYAGPMAGRAGWLLQRLIARLPQHPIAYSALHARRLRTLRSGSPIPVLRGLLPAGMDTGAPDPAQPLLVSVGRLIPEKQTAAIVPALAQARQRLPTLRAVIYGDGPQREAIARAARAADLDAVVACPGFVAAEIVTATLRRALCLVLLSRREGYGLVVAEAAAQGVPSVVLRHPDNAAAELIVEGVNGTLCASADPADVASAILRIHNAGADLRQSTLAWFCANAGTLTVDASLPRVLAIYRDGASEGRNGG